jgi:hypothetical protein
MPAADLSLSYRPLVIAVAPTEPDAPDEPARLPQSAGLGARACRCGAARTPCTSDGACTPDAVAAKAARAPATERRGPEPPGTAGANPHHRPWSPARWHIGEEPHAPGPPQGRGGQNRRTCRTTPHAFVKNPIHQRHRSGSRGPRFPGDAPGRCAWQSRPGTNCRNTGKGATDAPNRPGQRSAYTGVWRSGSPARTPCTSAHHTGLSPPPPPRYLAPSDPHNRR